MPGKEVPLSGVYRLGRDGRWTSLVRALNLPNGLAFAPDEKLLYVAVSDPKAPNIYVFDVRPDGTLDDGKLFFKAAPLAPNHPGLPDGMKVDQWGNLFATGPGGVLIIAPSGQLLGRLSTGDLTANCAWGGDGSVLYMTVNHSLARIQTRTRGAVLP